MIKVVSYCRVSTDQADQANSFEAQQRYFREYIQNHRDWTLQEIYADQGITGTSTRKRTQFNRMMNDAYEGRFQLILTKEVSRFSRNILDTIRCTRELRDMGIGVIFVNDRINTLDPEAEMLLSFLASLAQEESRKTSSRVVWGQTRQMERGVVFGQSLLGYDVKGGKITVNREGADIVRLIFHKYALEQQGTTEIARFLTEMGYKNSRGSEKWLPGSLVKILNNEKYVGDLIQKKTYTPDYLSHEKKVNRRQVPRIAIRDHHEPIISRELWELAQKRLRNHDKHGKENTGHSNRYVFSGKIRCGQCGAAFVGRFKYLKDGSKIRRWSCGTAVNQGVKGCDVGKLVRDDDAMQMLKTAIRSLPLDFDAIIRSVTELVPSVISTPEKASAALPEEIRLLQKKKEAVLDSYFSGDISREDMLQMVKKYEVQIHLRQPENSQTPPADLIRRELTGILQGETESEVFLKNMLESLTVFRDRHMELRLQGLDWVFSFCG